MKIIKDTTNGSKWIEISLVEYEQNYTNKVNYTYAYNQDAGRVGYYKRDRPKEYDGECFDIKNERMED